MKKIKLYKCLPFVLTFTFSGLAASEVLLPHGVPDPINTWVDANFQGQVVNPLTGVAPQSWQAAKDLGLPAFYIDSAHSNATNSNNPFGSPSAPRLTIPEGDYAAGSYIEIHGGPYDGGGQIIFNANGTPDKPIWFRGASLENKAVINGETIVKGKYVFIENIRFEQKALSLRTHNNSSLSHVVIRNSIFVGDGELSRFGNAIAIYSLNDADRFHDFVIYNNEISQRGNDFDDVDTALGATTENDAHGVHPDLNVDRVWILKNKIHNLGGDSVQVGRATIPDQKRPRDIYIADNEFHSNLENGVDVKEADNTLIIGNKIYNWREHKGNPSTGAAIVIHNQADNTWVVNNHIYNAADGVLISQGATETWVVGNVIENIRHSHWDLGWDPKSIYSTGSAIHFRGAPSGGAVNNTLINIDKGIESSSGGFLFINNIINERNEVDSYDIAAASSKAVNDVANNLIFHKNYQFNYKYATCPTCIHEEPKFSPSEGETRYAIDNTSPAISSGSSISEILTRYESVFKAPLTLDITGNNRVLGTVDIGAYENQNNADFNDVSLPLAPTLIEVIEQ